MRSGRWITVLTLFGLALAAPLASADPTTGVDSAACLDAAGSPPCGWITPFLDLIIPDKPTCGGNLYLGQAVDPSECMAPPTDGTPVVLTGEFRLYWEISEEATYLNDPNSPIVVSFSGTNRNPDFIDYAIEPSSFTLDTATLFSTDHIKVVDDGSGTSVWYDYRQPVTITFTRNGDPTLDDLERIDNQDGVALFNIKMQSTESGERFKPGWGLEPFKFHMDNEPGAPSGAASGERSTPGPGLLGLLGALGLAAVARRR